MLRLWLPCTKTCASAALPAQLRGLGLGLAHLLQEGQCEAVTRGDFATHCSGLDGTVQPAGGRADDSYCAANSSLGAMGWIRSISTPFGSCVMKWR